MRNYLAVALQQALASIIKDGPDDTYCGICKNVDDALCDAMDLYETCERDLAAPDAWRRLAFTKWPEYSGNENYPVPSTYEGVSPEQAYWDASGIGRKWEGDYGVARIRLTEFLLDRITTELEAGKHAD